MIWDIRCPEPGGWGLGRLSGETVNEAECEGLLFFNIDSARVMNDVCSPGCGPGMCGMECGANKNCVACDREARFCAAMGDGDISSNRALMLCGVGGMIMMEAGGGVGG